MKQRRSKSLRAVRIKVPRGVKIIYKKRKPAKARCAITKEVLKGIPRGRPYQIRKLAKTEKRPSRPYGGVLSSKASRRVLMERLRENV